MLTAIPDLNVDGTYRDSLYINYKEDNYLEESRENISYIEIADERFLSMVDDSNITKLVAETLLEQSSCRTFLPA